MTQARQFHQAAPAVSAPALSVVMSVHNGEAYLAEAVQSILAQTFTDFEFIIIDDGSTDKTAQILSDYAQRDARVRIFRQQNRGRAESLNHGIALASASLIARMDADDISFPHRFEQQIEFMNARPDVGLLGGAVEYISPDGRELRVFDFPYEDSELRTAMDRGNQFCHPAVMMRKEVVMAAQGYRRALLDADDYDLFLRMAEHAQIASLAQRVLAYRVHPGQASVRKMAQQSLCVLAARAAASLRSRGLPDPLWTVDEVTPDLVRSMSVTDDEIRRAAVAHHGDWMPLLAGVDSDSALRLIDGLLALCHSGPGQRSAAANALMQAASIHRSQGRFTKALVCAGRGIVAHPAVVGRHLKMAIARRVRAFNTKTFRQGVVLTAPKRAPKEDSLSR